MDKIENISQELKEYIITEILGCMELADELDYSDKQGVASASMAKILTEIQKKLNITVDMADDDCYGIINGGCHNWHFRADNGFEIEIVNSNTLESDN